MDKTFDSVQFIKELREGKEVKCPECKEGIIRTNYDPKISHYFCCDKCKLELNIN